MMKANHSLLVRTAVIGIVLLLGLAPTAVADDDHPSGSTVYHHIGTVTEPAVSAIAAGKTTTNPTGLFASFDISWVDSARDAYYLADRSNNAVDVVDATDGSFVKFLGQGQFAGVIASPPFPPGPNRSGPDGVVTDQHGNVWVGDGLINGVGHSSLKAFNPDTGAPLAGTPIDTLGAARSDELAFGNVGGGRILIANPNEPTVAFVTLVNTETKTTLAQVKYDAPANATGVPPAGHGFNTFFGTPTPSQHGLEQPGFADGKFYLNVPATVQSAGGEIDVSDPNTGVITAVFPLATCGGTGLAVLPHNELLVECGDSVRILDAKNGSELARFTEFGASDEIWFNPGDGRAYFSLVPNATLQPPRTVAGLGVLDVANRKSLGITPLAGAQGLHSIAADAHNNRIFIPINDNPDNGAGGIAMLHAAQQRHDSGD